MEFPEGANMKPPGGFFIPFGGFLNSRSDLKVSTFIKQRALSIKFLQVLLLYNYLCLLNFSKETTKWNFHVGS